MDTFPEIINSEIDPTCRMRRLEFRDAAPLFDALKGDEKGWKWFLEDLELSQAPRSIRQMRKMIEFLKNDQDKVAYVVEVRQGAWASWRVIGFSYYNIEDIAEEEVETSVFFSRDARGLGYHEAITFARLKTVIDMGLMPTRWVDIRNDRSNAASSAMGMLDRQEEWEGHEYNVYVVTAAHLPQIEEICKERFERKVQRRNAAA
jgi:hypothetical protein